MKITIYTITDCQFSKQEKDYLKSHNLAFEEKNLETNHEFLTEMLNISNNFAGTPVTVIEKDIVASGGKTPTDQASKPEEKKSESGDITKKDEKRVILKGFTVEEFDLALGFSKKEGEAESKEAQPKKEDQNKEEPKKVEEKKDEKPLVTVQTTIETPAVPAPASQQPPLNPQSQQQAAPMPQQPPMAQTPPPAAQPTNIAPQTTISQTAAADMQTPQPSQPQINVDPSLPATPQTDMPITDDSLDAILKDLQEKAGVTESTSQAPQNAPAQPQAVAQAPQVPPQQPQAPTAPAIPDFGSS